MEAVMWIGKRRERWRRRRHFGLVHLELGEQRWMKLVEVLWHRVRIHLDVRETLGMALEVHLQVALGGEPVAANVALERAFACVRPNVDLQCRIAAEHLTAIAATVLEQLVLLASRRAGRLAAGRTRRTCARAAHAVPETELVGQIGGE